MVTALAAAEAAVTETAAAAEDSGSGHQVMTISLFLTFVAITLGITIWASRQNRSAADFYAGGRSFHRDAERLRDRWRLHVRRLVLGIAGLIALYGYDGFLYSIGFLVAWLVALLLVAELMRNTGKFTMADVLSFRMRQRPGADRGVHLHRRGVDLLPAGPDGRGRELVSLLLGISSQAAKNLVIAGWAC